MTTPSYGSPSYPPPPQGSPYGQPYPVQPGHQEPVGPPPSKATAIWSLVLGWIPFFLGWVVAVILAIVVLNRSGDGRNHGRKLAIGGLVGVGFWVAVIVAVFVFRPLAAHRDDAGNVTRAGNVTIDGLHVGDCGDHPPTGPTNIMHVVPCSQPHDYQVLTTFELSGDYPGDAVVVRRAEAGCEQRVKKMAALRGHVGLQLSLMRPEASSWTRQKTVVCMASTEQPTTGSLLSNS
ncbi:MAG: hypothetical protein QM747_07555 [Nocardioides sp.]